MVDYIAHWGARKSFNDCLISILLLSTFTVSYYGPKATYDLSIYKPRFSTCSPCISYPFGTSSFSYLYPSKVCHMHPYLQQLSILSCESSYHFRTCSGVKSATCLCFLHRQHLQRSWCLLCFLGSTCRRRGLYWWLSLKLGTVLWILLRCSLRLGCLPRHL